MAKVLIVENEHLIALSMEDSLISAGHTVVGIAATTAKALSIAEKWAPELAIVNVGLDNNESGIEAARQLKQRQKLAVIFHTSKTDDATKAAALAVKPAAFLGKHTGREEFARLVNAVLAAAQRQHGANS